MSKVLLETSGFSIRGISIWYSKGSSYINVYSLKKKLYWKYYRFFSAIELNHDKKLFLQFLYQEKALDGFYSVLHYFNIVED